MRHMTTQLFSLYVVRFCSAVLGPASSVKVASVSSNMLATGTAFSKDNALPWSDRRCLLP